MKWPEVDEIDGETEQLWWIVEHGWDWEWPGWKWVANRLNEEYGNKRSAAACRTKFNRLEERAH